MIKNIQIGSVNIGDGNPPLFLADIGTFFNQDMTLAKEMIVSLKKSGCEFIKGEILHNANICLDNETTETYLDPAKGLVTEKYRDLIERKVVSLDEYAMLFNYCKELNIQTVMSVYDLEGVDFAIEHDCKALKIASSNISHEPLIRYVASKSIPVLIDTGKATFMEIARAIQWARDSGNDRLVIEHSPNAPPAPIKEQYLNMLHVLRCAFGMPVGLSDHHAGNEMMIAAAALGANILEKGVYYKKDSVDQDVAHAMHLSEVAELRTQCMNVYEALRSNLRWSSTTEKIQENRMGLIAKCDLNCGDTINLDKITFAFPVQGIGCEYWTQVLNWKIKRSVKAETAIKWCDIEPMDT